MADRVRMLLVEDDPVFAAVVRRAVERHGWAVRRVTDASEALRALEEELPDVLLTDYLLPGANGGALAAEVLARLDRHAPLMLLMSATPDLVSDEERGRFAAVLRKPFPLDGLLSTVERLLEARRAQVPASGPRLRAGVTDGVGDASARGRRPPVR
ncbi:MAG: response regulator [Myxococcota bacterium]|nr:response regulator [Myxococcota bacterium]MDW8360780.1 response regulator [Myxococcales bacterium]